MAAPELKTLFNTERLPDGFTFVPVILYFPLGIVLATIRLFITLHALLLSFLLPKTWFIRRLVLRIMFGVTGIIISTDGDENYDRRAKVFVSNHISPLDNFVTGFIVPHICPIQRQLSPLLQWITGCKELNQDRSKEEIANIVKKLCQESSLPLLFYPEKATTNGRIGLLKFSTLPFELEHLIQPVSIQVKRVELFNINVSTLTSTWWGDLFWCLFVPYTVFKLRFMPVTEKKDSESTEEFSERVRSNMARFLNLQLTDFTHSDKSEYVKRKPDTIPTDTSTVLPPDGPPLPASKQEMEPRTVEIVANPEVKAMVLQIKNVLPHVPVAAILKDIKTTKDVDTTITNFLEGNIRFTPEDGESHALGDSQHKEVKNLAQPTFKAQNFARNATDRQMSFQERKKQMIETARRKYKLKHNLV